MINDEVRQKISAERAKLPAVDSQGRAAVGFVLSDVTTDWRDPRQVAHLEAYNQGLTDSTVMPEGDGTLSSAERQAAVEQRDAAVLAAAAAAAAPEPGAAPESTGRVPKPDLSQGGLGGGSANLDSQIAEAQKAGDFRKVIALQRQKSNHH
jgi:hypothetical protein